MMKKFLLLSIWVSIGLISVTLAQKTLTWKSTSSTAWATAANWYDEGTGAASTTSPTSSDIVKIDNSRGATATTVVVNTASQACKQLTVGNGYILQIGSSANSTYLTVGDNTSGNYDIIIQSGGEIQNVASGSSGTPFTPATAGTDVMRIENGGKYYHNTGRSFSTPFPNGSRSFADNSTVEFAQNSAAGISMSGSVYGNLILSSTSSKVYTNSGTQGTTINGTLTLSSTSTLTASLTGTYTIKNINNSGAINFPTSASVTTPTTISGNITNSGTINFPTLASSLTISGNITNTGTINFNATTPAFNGSTTISGSAGLNFVNGASVSSSGTFLLGQNLDIPTGKTFTVNGTLNCSTYQLLGQGTLAVSSSGTIIIGSLSATNCYSDNIAIANSNINTTAMIEINGTAAQKLGGMTVPCYLRINNAAGVQLTGAVIVNRGFTLRNGVCDLNGNTLTLGTGAAGNFNFYKMYGSFSGSPVFNYANMTVDYSYIDTINAVTTGNEIPSSISGTLTVSVTNGLTLSAPLSADALSLDGGNLNTNSGLLTITGSAASKVTSRTYYINGPLARTLPASLAAGSTYNFPIGKTAIRNFELVNPTTSSSGACVIKAEVFDADCQGQPGSNLYELYTNRYWVAEITSGAANFTNSKIRLTESDLVSTSGIGQASDLYGDYNSIGGVFTGPTVISANSTTFLGNSTTYFCIGTKSNMGRLYANTYTVGSGNYPNLGAVLDTLNSEIITGGNVIFELSPSYSTTESLPLTFYPFADEGHNYTVTIRPASGATARTVSGASSSGVFVMDGADRIILDGRPGGTGTSRELTIQNTTVGASVPAVLMQNDASHNILQYLTLKAQDTSTTGGVVILNGTNGTLGNDTVTIANCDIDASGCAVGIYSFATTGKESNYGTISNCNIHDFYVSTSSSNSTYGIRLGSNNNGWIISGNSLYQTASRAYNSVDVQHQGIYISNTGGGYSITGNYIGGNAPLCGGTPWTISSGSARFFGMNLTTGLTTSSSIQGNLIKNMAITSACSLNSTPFAGIYIGDGSFDIGTVSGNTVGALDATDNILVTLTGATASSNTQITGYYLQTATGGTINFQNNTIAGTSLALNTTNYCDFFPILIGSSSAAGIYNVTNNTVGSLTTANSLQTRNSTASSTFYLRGIYASNGTITVSGNTVKNLNMLATGTGAKLWGIGGSRTSTTASAVTVSSNTVCNLSSSSLSRSGSSSSIIIGIGINYGANSQAQTVSGNSIYGLQSNATGTLTYVLGIFNETAQSAPENTIEKNKIYGLTAVSDTGTVNGIYISTGPVMVRNNMVALGRDISGNDITKPYDVTGIRIATSAACKIYFNTIKLSGVVSSSYTSATIYSQALRRSTTGVDSVYSNIFINSRTSSAATNPQRHFCLNLNAATTFHSNYNLLSNAETSFGTVDNGAATLYADFQEWKDSTSKDLNSVSKSVTFASETDLHLSGGSIGDGDLHGLPRGNATDDIDGQTRNTTWPYLGCDEHPETVLFKLLTLSAIPEGFYSGGRMNCRDTMKVCLHSAVSPYGVIDSAYAYIDSINGTGEYYLYHSVLNTNYYISVHHRNSLAAYSSSTVQFTTGDLTYDFTTETRRALGRNLVLKDGKACMYSGDVNQDGAIDYTDMRSVDAASLSYTKGNYISADLNGDKIVDFSDIAIADNNSQQNLSVITPSSKNLIKEDGVKQTEKENPAAQKNAGRD